MKLWILPIVPMVLCEITVCLTCDERLYSSFVFVCTTADAFMFLHPSTCVFTPPCFDSCFNDQCYTAFGYDIWHMIPPAELKYSFWVYPFTPTSYVLKHLN